MVVDDDSGRLTAGRSTELLEEAAGTRPGVQEVTATTTKGPINASFRARAGITRAYDAGHRNREPIALCAHPTGLLVGDQTPNLRVGSGTLSGRRVPALVLRPGGCERRRMGAQDLAAEMMAEAVADGQSARKVVTDADAAALRQALRVSARAGQIRIRTARMDTAVVLVRLDADLWNQDAATMRAKLTPPV